MKIYPVIMCGGAGTRLWPVSTQDHPKQFHRLVTNKSVFQDTVLRFADQTSADVFAPPIIISNGRYEGLIKQQLDAIGVQATAILLEPFARNTAAVAAVAARYIQQIDPEALGLLLPSDHFIGQPDVFISAIKQATQVAMAGKITTFGIEARHPETGFGYIEAGSPISDDLYEVAAFKEKPDLATAIQYLQAGTFTWNAGIFLFSPQTMVNELDAHAPDVLKTASRALGAAEIRDGIIALDAAIFDTVRSISIDYAVMEQTSCAAVYAPLNCQWSDIGTWAEIGDLKRDDSGIAPIEIDTENCSVHSDSGQLVALVGVSDLCVVVEGDKILVTAKDRTQDVGQIVKTLKDMGKTEFL